MGAKKKGFRVKFLSPTLSGIKGAFRGFKMFPSVGNTATTVTETDDRSTGSRRLAGFRYGETTVTETTSKANYIADSDRNTTVTATETHRNRNTATTVTETDDRSTGSRFCQKCGTEIPKSKSIKAKYCSDRCKNDAYLERRKNKIG